MTPEAKAVRRILRESLRGRGRDVAGLAVWSLIQALPAFLSGRLIATSIDHGFLRHRPATGIGWLALLGVSVVAGAWGTRQSLNRLANIVEPFRDELVARAVHGALARSVARGASADSAAVARLTQQVEIAREAFANVLIVVQGFLVTTVSALLGLVTLMPLVLVLVVPPLIVALTVFAFALGPMAARQRESILADERIAESVASFSGGLRDIAASGAEDVVATTIGRHIDEQARATVDLAKLTAVRTAIVAIGGWLPVLLILASGSWLRAHGATTGAIIGALTYVSQGVHSALQKLVRGLANTGLWLMVTLRRIIQTTAPDESAQPRVEGLAAAKSGISLSNVSFAYGPHAIPVIRAADMRIEPGDHVAIVGPSGIGKSTLADLISGVLVPQIGMVLVDGMPTAGADAGALATRRVLIPQEAYVFSGTLRENLAYLNDGCSDADLEASVNALGLHAFVRRLGSYDAIIDPATMSAGERQLITLVRAHVSLAPTIVLDEATCHLDPGTEARVERAFRERDGTLIVVAHRISSAMRAKRIVVLDGERMDVGSHAELLERSKLYRDLVGRWDPGIPVPGDVAPIDLSGVS